MMTPPCFESDKEFQQWSELDTIAYGKRDRLIGGYCRDCTLSYALQMRREGRCIQPQVRFELNPEGERIGIGFSMVLAKGGPVMEHSDAA